MAVIWQCSQILHMSLVYSYLQALLIWTTHALDCSYEPFGLVLLVLVLSLSVLCSAAFSYFSNKQHILQTTATGRNHMELKFKVKYI